MKEYRVKLFRTTTREDGTTTGAWTFPANPDGSTIHSTFTDYQEALRAGKSYKDFAEMYAQHVLECHEHWPDLYPNTYSFGSVIIEEREVTAWHVGPMWR